MSLSDRYQALHCLGFSLERQIRRRWKQRKSLPESSSQALQLFSQTKAWYHRPEPLTQVDSPSCVIDDLVVKVNMLIGTLLTFLHFYFIVLPLTRQIEFQLINWEEVGRISLHCHQ